jgi:hypothetical protein
MKRVIRQPRTWTICICGACCFLSTALRKGSKASLPAPVVQSTQKELEVDALPPSPHRGDTRYRASISLPVGPQHDTQQTENTLRRGATMRRSPENRSEIRRKTVATEEPIRRKVRNVFIQLSAKRRKTFAVVPLPEALRKVDYAENN